MIPVFRTPGGPLQSEEVNTAQLLQTGSLDSVRKLAAGGTVLHALITARHGSPPGLDLGVHVRLTLTCWPCRAVLKGCLGDLVICLGPDGKSMREGTEITSAFLLLVLRAREIIWTTCASGEQVSARDEHIASYF